MKDMQLNSGIFRTTFRQRFQHLDQAVNQRLRQQFQPSGPLQVEDWAASDCLTSSEWASSLLADFPRARLTASDLTLFLLEVRLPNGEAFILEGDGAPLQYLRGPFVIRLRPKEPVSVPLNRWLCYRALGKLEKLQSQLRISQEWLNSAEVECALGSLSVRKISVVHPEADAFQRQEPRFTIRRHSAFESLPAPVDVIRTVNIFNLGYFSPERLAQGSHAVWLSLKAGGVWITGRTVQQDPPLHDVTLFERNESGFRLIERHGQGAEIESLVLGQRWQ